jgi:uncharacterized protein YdhG (YjbR/CyaY superfamily)
MKRERNKGTKDVDEYLARVPRDKRPILQKLRETIRAAAPKAEEVVSYRIPAFRLNGKLVWYAGFEDHCSLFVGYTERLRSLAPELRPFRAGKGTLQFTPERPIPAALVRRIVRERFKLNRSAIRSKKTTRTATSPKRRNVRSTAKH